MTKITYHGAQCVKPHRANLKIRIRVAQNVVKVQISEKKKAPGTIWDHFMQIFPWAGKI